MLPQVTCLADLVRIASQRDPAAVAIEHEHGQITYAQFWERSVRLANAMLARGLKTGDRVALFAQNCPEYLQTYVGLQLAGLVAVPANYRLTPPELSYLLDNSGAKALLIGEEYLPYLDKLREMGKRGAGRGDRLWHEQRGHASGARSRRRQRQFRRGLSAWAIRRRSSTHRAPPVSPRAPS